MKMKLSDFVEFTNQFLDRKIELKQEAYDRKHEGLPRYWVSLHGVELKVGNSLLQSVCGRGDTLASARRSLVEDISNKKIVINAFQPDRKEILVPQLIP